MESNIKYISTDSKIHGRKLRPTSSFDKTGKQFSKNDSKEIRYYGTISKDTVNGKYKVLFTGDIVEKYKNGEIEFTDLCLFPDQDLLQNLNTKVKKELKSYTRVWRSRK